MRFLPSKKNSETRFDEFIPIIGLLGPSLCFTGVSKRSNSSYFGGEETSGIPSCSISSCPFTASSKIFLMQSYFVEENTNSLAEEPFLWQPAPSSKSLQQYLGKKNWKKKSDTDLSDFQEIWCITTYLIGRVWSEKANWCSMHSGSLSPGFK